MKARLPWILAIIALFVLAACGPQPPIEPVPTAEPAAPPEEPAAPTFDCNDESHTWFFMQCMAVKPDGTYYVPDLTIGCRMPEGTLVGEPSPFTGDGETIEYVDCVSPTSEYAYVVAAVEDRGALVRVGPGGEYSLESFDAAGKLWWIWSGHGIVNYQRVRVLGCTKDRSDPYTTFATHQYATPPDENSMKFRALVEYEDVEKLPGELVTGFAHGSVLDASSNETFDLAVEAAEFNAVCDVSTLP